MSVPDPRVPPAGEINCLPAFSAYTGLDLLSQEVLDVGYMVPSNDSWQEGDRTIICYVARVDDTAVNQSVRTAH
ncbi:MAG: septum formation family protein [Chloroflexota bacterium]|nr:septum formation family protein [Chloroflexota bacterium]